MKGQKRKNVFEVKDVHLIPRHFLHPRLTSRQEWCIGVGHPHPLLARAGADSARVHGNARPARPGPSQANGPGLLRPPLAYHTEARESPGPLLIALSPVSTNKTANHSRQKRPCTRRLCCTSVRESRGWAYQISWRKKKSSIDFEKIDKSLRREGVRSDLMALRDRLGATVLALGCGRCTAFHVTSCCCQLGMCASAPAAASWEYRVLWLLDLDAPLVGLEHCITEQHS